MVKKMSRLNNLVLSYKIVEDYNKKLEKPLLPFVLKDYIKQRTAVRDDTAKEYMTALENGIFIEGKLYKIILRDGGYSCLKK